MSGSALKPATELARGNNVRFPNESAEYRRAREQLLTEEIELRRHIERVAELRRALPPGGAVTKNYAFEGEGGKATLPDLFGNKQTLVIYSYMFGPQREQPCPMCTSFMSTWEAKLPDVEQRIAFVFVARSPIARLIEAKKARGWTQHRIYSDASGDYTRDYVSAAGCGRARLQRVHAPRRQHPPFLVRRNGTVDRRSRAGPARRARHRSAVDHPRHHARRARQGLVPAVELLAPRSRLTSTCLQIRELMYVIARFRRSMERRCFV